MIKILHILAWVSRNAGGLFESVPGLTKGLANAPDCEVHVMGVDDPFSATDRGKWLPVEVHTTPVYGPRRLCYAPDMRGIIKSVAPDIMHSHAVWTWPAKIVNERHKTHNIPYVLSTRGTLDSWALQQGRLKKALVLPWFQQQHFQNAACIHALCEAEAESIRAYGLKNPIAIIPNGIELPELKSRQSRLESRQPKKRLLFLGRIHPKKGLKELIQAWRTVSRERWAGGSSGQWELVVAGWDDGGHLVGLKQQAADLNLTWSEAPGINQPPTDLRFIGPQFGAQKDQLLRGVDAFILPSFSEGLPMSVLEAWSYGIPVVMTPECNLPDGFRTDAAFQVSQRPESIATGLQALFEMSDHDRLSMGAKGRTLVEQKFTWPHIAAKMKAVYEWVLGGGERPEDIQR